MKIRKHMSMFGLAGAAALAIASSAGATIVTQWNFNSNPPDANSATGILTPNIGSGTAVNVGGTSSAFGSGDANGGSADPVTGTPTDDSGWQTSAYAAQGVNSGGTGVGFAVSTVGYDSLIVSWDQRHSNTSSKYAQFQYSLDGINFTSAGLLNSGIFEATTGGDTWYNSRSVDLSSVAGVANNASFAFRIVAVFDPANGANYTASTTGSSYAASGTWRFDMVTVHGAAIPVPGALALLCVAGIASRRRRR